MSDWELKLVPSYLGTWVLVVQYYLTNKIFASLRYLATLHIKVSILVVQTPFA